MTGTRPQRTDSGGKAALAVKPLCISDFGAVGDGRTLCTAAIQAAIDACHTAGGGVVRIPEGVFLTATVCLRDRVTLHLTEGSTLLGSNRIADYPEQPRTGTRMDDFLSRGLLVARRAEHIAVVGCGTIDGQGRFRQNDFLDDAGRRRRYRPMLIWFDQCAHIRVDGVSLRASGFWTQTYSRCRDGLVRGVNVRDSVNDNNDGCDLVDSSDFVVEQCDIDCIDDGICLKAYTEAGCRNIIIRHNRIKSLCNAIKTGTDSSGQGFQDIRIEHNELYQVGRAGLALETTDGGQLKRVHVSDLRMDVVGTPLFIKLGDRLRPVRGTDGRDVVPNQVGQVQDILICGIRAVVDDESMPVKDVYTDDEKRLYAATKPHASSISGIPGHGVKDILIEDVAIEVRGGYGEPITEQHAWRDVPENTKKYPNPDMFGTLPAFGLFCRHVNGLTLRDVRIVSGIADPRPAIVLDDVHDATVDCGARNDGLQTPWVAVRPNCTRVAVEASEPPGDRPASDHVLLV